VSKPKGRETRKDKLNQVQKGGLDIAKGEVGGPWVFAYFGTDVDQRKGTIRVDMDRVVGISAEGSDEEWGCGGLLEPQPPPGAFFPMVETGARRGLGHMDKCPHGIHRTNCNNSP